MTIPKWLVIVLMVVSNTLGGVSGMHFFNEGSKGYMALALAGLIVGNVIAVLGIPLAGKTPAPGLPLPPDQSNR